MTWEFPGGPAVRILDFYCLGPGSIPGPHNTTKKKEKRFTMSDFMTKTFYILYILGLGHIHPATPANTPVSHLPCSLIKLYFLSYIFKNVSKTF